MGVFANSILWKCNRNVFREWERRLVCLFWLNFCDNTDNWQRQSLYSYTHIWEQRKLLIHHSCEFWCINCRRHIGTYALLLLLLLFRIENYLSNVTLNSSWLSFQKNQPQTKIVRLSFFPLTLSAKRTHFLYITSYHFRSQSQQINLKIKS